MSNHDSVPLAGHRGTGTTGRADCESAARLADIVRAHRRTAGLTQQELAARAGLSLAGVRDLEQGRRSRPRPGSLAALADALGLDRCQAEDLALAAAAPRRKRGAAREPDMPSAGATRSAAPRGPGRGLWLSILGPVEAWRDGVPLCLGPPARRAVLGLLAADPGVLVRRDTIIDVLWGQEPPNTAVSLVQAHISRLRRLLAPRTGPSPAGDDVIVCFGGGYRLQLTDGQLDLFTFRELVASAKAMRAAGDELTACDVYEQALGMWRGDPLADMDVLRGQPGISELSRQLGDVLLGFAEVASDLGLHDRVLPRLQSLAAAEPLNERVHARLMIALAGAGQQAAAVRVYEDLRDRLDREFGVYPGEELVDAHLRVLHQDITVTNQRWSYGQRLPTAVRDHEVPRQLPATARYFTGRDSERGVLSGLLGRAQLEVGGVVIGVLTGMAGIGKTALAVNWAHQVADRFPDGQLFVNLRGFHASGGPVASSDALWRFLTALGVPPARIPPDTDARAALYRSMLASRRMLIVLDNAHDAEQVRPLLPGSPGCLVLVTSRNRLTGLAAADGANLLTLGVLTCGESSSLLAKVLGAERVIAEHDAVSQLIALCAQLPLALCDVAARAAVRPGLPLAALAAEMRDERGRLDALETGEPTTSVRVVFSWSHARLSELAAWMFQMLGVHPGPDITVAAAASLAGVSRSQSQVALAELCEGHLATEHTPGRYICHDLVRAYAAEAARTRVSEFERRTAIYRVLDHYLHTARSASSVLYPYLPQQARNRPWQGVLPELIRDAVLAAEWFEAERHVLLAAISHAVEGGYHPHVWELPWAAGLFFRGEWNWRKMADAQESALEIADRLGDLTGQALARHHLGWLMFWLGEDAEACRHLVEVIALVRRRGDGRFRALADLIRSRVLQSQNPIPEGLVQAGQSLRLYQAEGSRAGEVRALDAIGWQLAEIGACATAGRYGNRTLALHSGTRAIAGGGYVSCTNCF